MRKPAGLHLQKTLPSVSYRDDITDRQSQHRETERTETERGDKEEQRGRKKKKRKKNEVEEKVPETFLKLRGDGRRKKVSNFFTGEEKSFERLQRVHRSIYMCPEETGTDLLREQSWNRSLLREFTGCSFRTETCPQEGDQDRDLGSGQRPVLRKEAWAQDRDLSSGRRPGLRKETWAQEGDLGSGQSPGVWR
ncbi:Hypothetical predicted protein [Xyrichtys novacula]|uniref:Uncharacterized protein n=1 Tax=Xyrichtys novacula TaxID=13765 RepID=A0AAV1GTB2_XYRNO|nr:Hypothetical predicted protein [Xyrichtys novacula]